ncbi:hypothetical protein AAG570_011250 [Ranatra chinensis]|uniref:Uncharacterized protein n=1 Tax=Ranatra chinensis TaxID=642074 RepID=A0ABD0YWC3_9HEMI
MGDKSKDFIVMGEASESEDETDSKVNVEPQKLEDAVVAGEASESDSEGESNWKLKEHLKELCFESLRNVGSCVNEVNQELLSSQILLQEAVSVMRRSMASTAHLGSALTSLVAHGSRAFPDFVLPTPSGTSKALAQPS